ncbi:MAG: Spy/CpxP family protein refolding chaperone [Bacteroidales bacterium]|nr:Spy/CpxP family protein refolding chaperone [Bacteroidales bacterium]
MEIITKKRLLIGTIVILLIMNISALSTIAYYKYSAKKHIEQIREKKKRGINSYRGKNYGQRVKKYVRKELNLSDEQFKKYSHLKDINMQKSRDLWKQINEKRSLTFKEYCKEHPDTLLLMQLSEDIGNLHKQVHREMIRHFNEVEKILDPEQKKQFREMLCKMAEHKKGRKYKN